MTDRPLLRVEALTVGYRDVPLLPPLTFNIAAGQTWVILGRNGSGKTTLLRSILGLQPVVSGGLHWCPGLRVGYVAQRATMDLSIPARVLDVVSDGLDRDWSFCLPLRHDRLGLVRRVLGEVGLSHVARSAYQSLSEGQKQRVLLARALVSEPGVLILDEPTSAMDVASEKSMFELLDQLRQERHLALLVVGHHVAMLIRKATHLAVVDADERRVVTGEVAEVAATPWVHALYGDMVRNVRERVDG